MNNRLGFWLGFAISITGGGMLAIIMFVGGEVSLVFLPIAMFLYGLGVWGMAVETIAHRSRSEHILQKMQRDELKEQKRIDREFRKIQRRGKRQFKQFTG